MSSSANHHQQQQQQQQPRRNKLVDESDREGTANNDTTTDINIDTDIDGMLDDSTMDEHHTTTSSPATAEPLSVSKPTSKTSTATATTTSESESADRRSDRAAAKRPGADDDEDDGDEDDEDDSTIVPLSKKRFKAMQEAYADLVAKNAALVAEKEETAKALAAEKEATALLKEETAKAHAAENAEKDEALALLNGTYYDTIDEVWGGRISREIDDVSVFDRLKRSSLPNFVSRSAAALPAPASANRGINEYDWTKQAAENDTFTVAMKSERTLSSDQKKQIFPTDIFGNKKTDDFPIAHLVPHSKDNASLYHDIAIWAFGFNDDNSHSTFETVQKAIHGSNRKGRKVPHTGLKHFVSNKICLASQEVYFDNNPCVLIVPVMSMENMLQWKDNGYKAIVMVGQYNNGDSASDVCQRICMLNRGEIASATQIETARALLEDVILGMAYWLKHRLVSFRSHLENETAKKQLLLLENTFRSITGEGVTVPNTKSEVDYSLLKVRMVEFYDVSDADHHPAPDPLLLAVKAATTWSRRHDEPLKAAAEPQDEKKEDDDDDDDELSILAEEQFLERRANALRPQTWDDLARGLGQPLGYQEDGTKT